MKIELLRIVIGDPANKIPPHPDANERESAVLAIADTAGRDLLAKNLFIALIKGRPPRDTLIETSPLVRMSLVEALGDAWRGDPQVKEVLQHVIAQRLKDGAPWEPCRWVRWQAVSAFRHGWEGDAEVLATLRRVIGARPKDSTPFEPHANVRLEAFLVLKEIMPWDLASKAYILELAQSTGADDAVRARAQGLFDQWELQSKMAESSPAQWERVAGAWQPRDAA